MSLVRTTAVALITLPITILTVLLTTFFSLVPQSFAIRLLLIKDILISSLTLPIARLLPPLTLQSQPHNLHDKVAVVTGSNSGIGLQLATNLARQGATVVLACRSLRKAESAVNTIVWRVPAARGRVSAMVLDTSDLESVKRFALAWTERPEGHGKRIDVLCHNAGIATAPKGHALTEEGIETVYATNMLGSFLLTYLLEPYLGETARVLFTSSTGQYAARISEGFAQGPVRGVVEGGFHCPKSRVPLLRLERVNAGSAALYANSKAMQCAFARLLQRKWDRESITRVEKLGRHAEKVIEADGNGSSVRVRSRTVHSFSPGFTSTPIFGKLSLASFWEDVAFVFLRAATVLATDVDQGAATGSWLACTEDEEVVGFGKGGGYWDRMTRRVCKADLYGEALLERLWERWEADSGVVWPLR